MKLNAVDRFFLKKIPNIKSHKHPVGAELFLADGQTVGRENTTNIIVALRNFAKVPNHNFLTY
jgi:hypothetical protein